MSEKKYIPVCMHSLSQMSPGFLAAYSRTVVLSLQMQSDIFVSKCHIAVSNVGYLYSRMNGGAFSGRLTVMQRSHNLHPVGKWISLVFIVEPLPRSVTSLWSRDVGEAAWCDKKMSTLFWVGCLSVGLQTILLPTTT